MYELISIAVEHRTLIREVLSSISTYGSVLCTSARHINFPKYCLKPCNRWLRPHGRIQRGGGAGGPDTPFPWNCQIINFCHVEIFRQTPSGNLDLPPLPLRKFSGSAHGPNMAEKLLTETLNFNTNIQNYTFWERAAHLDDRLFSLDQHLFIIIIIIIIISTSVLGRNRRLCVRLFATSYSSYYDIWDKC